MTPDYTVVVNDTPTTVTVQEQPATVVTVGTQGPAGPPGLDAGAGSTLTVTTDTTVPGSVAVVRADTTAGDINLVIPADDAGRQVYVKKLVTANMVNIRLSLGGVVGTDVLTLPPGSGVTLHLDGTTTID